MVFDFKKLKAELKPEFHKNYEKYYPVESLKNMCFTRRVCSNCGRGFWSIRERDVCDEPACTGGYRFIGQKLTRKPFAYKEAWDEYVKIFSTWDYMPIDRYPVVCRWYDDLYFVSAGINDFQPYVVSGEVEPPAPAVLEPQFCLRFPDIDNVGVTGRHFTGFIMVGQHTFNTREYTSYFKEDGIQQIHTFLTQGLGISPEEIIYHEDVWAGGGNYGPSIEYFARGLELGNQVYMQYQVLPDGTRRELDTKVIDMGAGLERWAWFSQGVGMSYEAVFPKVLGYMYKTLGLKEDKRFNNLFGQYAGLLELDSEGDLGKIWQDIADNVGMTLVDLKDKVYEQRAFYSIAEHTRTLLVAIHDGALPSNVGGGYNLRILLRRVWEFMDEYNFNLDIHDIFEKHIREFGSWYTELAETGSLQDIVDTEYMRYLDTMNKSGKLVNSLIASGKNITVDNLVELYDSQGIRPDVISHLVEEGVPDNFYSLVEQRHRKKEKLEEEEVFDVPYDIPETVLGYYEDQNVNEFNAKVVKVIDDMVVLDKTYFYPEGGGQETDVGKIGEAKVTYVFKKSNVVFHKVDDISLLTEGEEYQSVLDDNRRFQLMQHHTATHIVNAAARKVLGPHIWQAGAHKSVESSRLDITHYKPITNMELAKIEVQANSIVDKGLKVDAVWMKRDEAEKAHGMRIYQGGAVPGTRLRIIDINGVDVEACGGTHLSNTRDVGKIIMLSAKRIQDGVVRLEFKAGSASVSQDEFLDELFAEVVGCFEEFEFLGTITDRDILNESAKVFSVEPKKLPETINRFRNELNEMNQKLNIQDEKRVVSDILDASRIVFEKWKDRKKLLEKQAGDFQINPVKSGETDGIAIFKEHTSGHNVKSLSEKANEFIDQQKDSILIIVNVDGERANVVVASKSKIDASNVVKQISGLLGGGGSGTPITAIGGGKSENSKKILENFEIKIMEMEK